MSEIHNEGILTFNDTNHTYHMDGVPYESVSRVFGMFKEDFNSHYHSCRMMFRDMYPDEYKKLPKGRSNNEFADILMPVVVKYKDVLKAAEDLRKEWTTKASKSTGEGTLIHTYLEDRSVARGYEINPFNGRRMVINPSLVPGANNRAYCRDLIDIPDGYYPELVLFNRRAKLAGQTDKGYIWTDLDGTRNAFLDDWKTDIPEKMVRTAFWHPTYGKDYLLDPLQHLENASVNNYEIKVSLYAWMLAEAGFKIRGMRITHINKETGEVTIHPLTYRGLEISNLIDLYIAGKDQRQSREKKHREVPT